jgi:hypothetical protein
MTDLNQNNHITRGDGAGGANTNANGLLFEHNTTDISSKYRSEKKIKDKKFNGINCSIIKFHGAKTKFIRANQANFFKVMKILCNDANTEHTHLHGAKRPDEAYIHQHNKCVFIIEKKMQKCPGSVCEKIQTGPAKKWSYQKAFPGWNIIYIYTLSDWFEKNCIGGLEYLKECNVPVFWGERLTYKDEIVDFIVNYNQL